MKLPGSETNKKERKGRPEDPGDETFNLDNLDESEIRNEQKNVMKKLPERNKKDDLQVPQKKEASA